MSSDLEKILKIYKEKLDLYVKKLQDLEEDKTMSNEEKFDILIKILDEINNEKTK
jgi:hypothetical protein